MPWDSRRRGSATGPGTGGGGRRIRTPQAPRRRSPTSPALWRPPRRVRAPGDSEPGPGLTADLGRGAGDRARAGHACSPASRPADRATPTRAGGAASSTRCCAVGAGRAAIGAARRRPRGRASPSARTATSTSREPLPILRRSLLEMRPRGSPTPDVLARRRRRLPPAAGGAGGDRTTRPAVAESGRAAARRRARPVRPAGRAAPACRLIDPPRCSRAAEPSGDALVTGHAGQRRDRRPGRSG